MRKLEVDDSGGLFYRDKGKIHQNMICAFTPTFGDQAINNCGFRCSALQIDSYSTEERGKGYEVTCLRLDSLAIGDVVNDATWLDTEYDTPD